MPDKGDAALLFIIVCFLEPCLRMASPLFLGDGNWKKKKGIAWIALDNGETSRAEIHWYEAHGIGKVEHKLKRFL